MVPHIPVILTVVWVSGSEASIMFLCQICSMHYTVVRIKNWSKITSVIRYSFNGLFPLRIESHHMLPPNRHFLLSTKMNRTQRDTDESMKNALYVLWCAKKAPLGLKWRRTVKIAIIELHLSEQSVSQSVSQ